MNKILVGLIAGFISIAAFAQSAAPAPAPAAPKQVSQSADTPPAPKKAMTAKKPVKKAKKMAQPVKKAKAKPAKKAA